MNLPNVFDGRYELGPLIGKGSFGLVVRTKCGRAVKYVPSETNYREITALNDCRHPNVVGLVESAVFDGALYLVLECWTMTLAQRLRMRPMSVEQANWVLLHMLTGLAHMHECGYLHRDLKPSNILIRHANDGCDLCLADFGHATPYPPRSEVVTLPTDPLQSSLVFTRWYRPPEVTLMMPYDEAADVFSVGCIFVEVMRHALGREPVPLFYESASSYPLSGTNVAADEHLFNLYRVLGTPTDAERSLWVAGVPAIANLLAFADELPFYAKCALGFPDVQTAWLSAMLAYTPSCRISASSLCEMIDGV